MSIGFASLIDMAMQLGIKPPCATWAWWLPGSKDLDAGNETWIMYTRTWILDTRAWILDTKILDQTPKPRTQNTFVVGLGGRVTRSLDNYDARVEL